MSELTSVAHNYLQAIDDPDGFTSFLRFFPSQLAAYENNVLFELLSHSAAGVYLSFKTTGTQFSFNCRKQSMAGQILPRLKEIGLSGLLDLTGSLREYARQGSNMRLDVLDDLFDVVCNGELLLSFKPKNGLVTIPLPNPDRQLLTIRLYLPLYFAVGLKDLTADGEICICPEDRQQILCLGDSITQGFFAGRPSQCYVARLAAGLQVDALNQGVGGYHYEAASLAGIDALPRPSLITVAYGTNDWHTNPSLDSIRANIQAYYVRLNDVFPGVPLIAITPIWRGDIDEPHAAGQLADVDQVIREETQAYANITVVDGLTLSPHDKVFFGDGWLHPNSIGFAWMAKVLLASLARSTVVP